MIAVLRERLSGLKSFPRGIHPPHRKEHSQAKPIRLFIPTRDLLIPMVQHIGTPCTPLVKPREEVTFGQKIADVDAPVSAPIHATVNGKMGAGTVALLPSGRRVPTMPLKPATEGDVLPSGVLEDFLDRNWDGANPADVHLVVHSQGPKGTSGVTRLTSDDRVAELARMLAGLGESDSGRAHARELLETAQNDRA